MSPERASSWVGALLPLVTQGGPVLTLFVLLVGAGMVWYMLGALERSVQRNHALVEKMITLQDTHRAELVRLTHCSPP